MSTQHHGRNLILLALLCLISACGSDQTSESKVQEAGGNGAETEVVAETPIEKTNVDTDDPTSETALREEETGVADLREFVDEIAPEPDTSESTASPSSKLVSPESDIKQESSPSDDKTPDTSTADTQDLLAFMVALADSGLQTVDVQTGSTLDILFEVDRDIAVSTVSTAFGDPTETVQSSECPAGPLEITTWPNGFSINTLDETFVGWSIRPNSGSENLTTIAGVGIGTSLSNLQAVYDIEIFESSLGTEFNVGQMSGLLSSNQPDGEITNLWAGLNCIFR